MVKPHKHEQEDSLPLSRMINNCWALADFTSVSNVISVRSRSTAAGITAQQVRSCNGLMSCADELSVHCEEYQR
jgi:hypothetical protein